MIEYDWNILTDNQFEELCKDLLLEAGVEAKRTSGPGSGDMGCDVLATEKIALKVGAIETFKILVQCKNYGKSKTTVSPKEVEEYALRAQTLNCDLLLLITSHDLSAQARICSEKISQSPMWKVKISYWTEAELVGRLLKSPTLSEKYFGTFPHRRKIKCYLDFPGFMVVSAKVTYDQRTTSARFLVNMNVDKTTISSHIAEHLGVRLEQNPRQNITKMGTLQIINDFKILRKVELSFKLDKETGEEEYYTVLLEEVNAWMDNLSNSFNFMGIDSFLSYGFLGLDVLKNFGISMKDGILYPP